MAHIRACMVAYGYIEVDIFRVIQGYSMAVGVRSESWLL